MIDIVRGQVIEMIATQAASLYSRGSAIKWDDMDTKPTFDEDWFWNNFNDIIDEAVMGVPGAIEGWVTVEYEQDIIDLIDLME